MNATTFVRMNSEQLSKEIDKQKKKIRQAQETIELLKKLQIAEQSKSHNQQSFRPSTPNSQNHGG